jgi:hypothetical protein
VLACRSSLALELLYAADYDTSRALRTVELLKLRFGEGALHACEVGRTSWGNGTCGAGS